MKKLSYEFVKEQIEKEGYKLLSKEYINAHSKLIVRCPKDHEYEIIYSNFKKGHRCPKCKYLNQVENLKLSYEFVKEQIEDSIWRVMG